MLLTFDVSHLDRSRLCSGAVCDTSLNMWLIEVTALVFYVSIGPCASMYDSASLSPLITEATLLLRLLLGERHFRRVHAT